MLEKRGRKAAQRALSELTNNREGTSRASTTTGSAKRRATRQLFHDGALSDLRHGRSVDVSVDEAFPSARYRAEARRSAQGLESMRSRDGVGCGGNFGTGNEVGDEENDAVWLREAEALLSRSGRDIGF